MRVPSPSLMSNRPDAIPALTGLRFMAALSVVLAQGLEAMTVQPGAAPVWRLCLEYSSAFGMSIFFVLSGFQEVEWGITRASSFFLPLPTPQTGMNFARSKWALASSTGCNGRRDQFPPPNWAGIRTKSDRYWFRHRATANGEPRDDIRMWQFLVSNPWRH